MNGLTTSAQKADQLAGAASQRPSAPLPPARPLSPGGAALGQQKNPQTRFAGPDLNNRHRASFPSVPCVPSGQSGHSGPTIPAVPAVPTSSPHPPRAPVTFRPVGQGHMPPSHPSLDSSRLTSHPVVRHAPDRCRCSHTPSLLTCNHGVARGASSDARNHLPAFRMRGVTASSLALTRSLALLSNQSVARGASANARTSGSQGSGCRLFLTHPAPSIPSILSLHPHFSLSHS